MSETNQRTVVVVIPLQNVTRLRKKLQDVQRDADSIHIASRARDAIVSIVDALIEALPDVNLPAAVPAPVVKAVQAPAVGSSSPGIFAVDGNVTAEQAIEMLNRAGVDAEITAPRFPINPQNP